MSLDVHEARLEALHGNERPAAVRFDPGPPLAGRIAVLPSAFNPPTRAHLGLLEVARAVEGITGIAALLTTNNVAKGIYGAALAHRIGMLLAAHEAEPALAVLASNSARILDQGRALSEAFADTGFDFVMGYDTLIRLFEPRYYEDMDRELDEFFGRHRAIATNRAAATPQVVEIFLHEPHVRRYVDRIVVRELDDERAALSSTGARERVSSGGVAEELPAAVRDYISRNGLYRV